MAANTTKFKSLRIVPEDVYGYGSVATGSRRPSQTIFNRAVALPVDAGELTVPDQPMVATIDQARAAFYTTPDEVDGLDDGATGDFVPHRGGQASFKLRAISPGDWSVGIYDPRDWPVFWLFGSALVDHGGGNRPIDDTDVVAVAGTTSTFTAGDGTKFAAGKIIQGLVGGTTTRARVIAVAGNDITHTLTPAAFDAAAIDILGDVPNTDAVNAAIDNYSFTATTPGFYAIGDVFKVSIDGLSQYAVVTNIDGNDIHHEPPFTRGLTNGDTVIKCRTFSSASTGTKTSLGLQFDALGERWMSWGARVVNVAWQGDKGTRMVTWTFTVELGHVERVENDPDVAAGTNCADAIRVGGKPAHFKGCEVVLTNALPVDVRTPVPYQLGRLVAAGVNVDSYSATITHEVEGDGESRTVLGQADAGTVNVNGTVDLALSTDVAALDADYDAQPATERMLVMGFGRPRVGEGFALVMPASHQLKSARGRERGGNRTRQSLSLGIGRGRGEASTTAPANTTLRIAFAL